VVDRCIGKFGDFISYFHFHCLANKIIVVGEPLWLSGKVVKIRK
jgi:hypothetical protein